jgi:hypothetical protein
VVLSLYGVPEAFGSCVSTAGSLTQEGSVEPSTPDDGLYVTERAITFMETFYFFLHLFFNLLTNYIKFDNSRFGGFVLSDGTTGTLSRVVQVTNVGEVDVTAVVLP